MDEMLITGEAEVVDGNVGALPEVLQGNLASDSGASTRDGGDLASE